MFCCTICSVRQSSTVSGGSDMSEQLVTVRWMQETSRPLQVLTSFRRCRVQLLKRATYPESEFSWFFSLTLTSYRHCTSHYNMVSTLEILSNSLHSTHLNTTVTQCQILTVYCGMGRGRGILFSWLRYDQPTGSFEYTTELSVHHWTVSTPLNSQ